MYTYTQISIILFYSIWFVCSIFSNYILFLLFICNFLFYVIFRTPKLHTIITSNEDSIKILFYIFANITFWVMDIGSKLIKAFDEKGHIYRKIQLLFSIFVLYIGSLIILYEKYGPLLTFIKSLSRKIIIIIPISIFIGIGMYFSIKKLDSYKDLPDIIVCILLLLLPICIFINYGSYKKDITIFTSKHYLWLIILVYCIIGFYIYTFSNNKDEDKNNNNISDEDADVNNSDDTSDEGDDIDGNDVDENTECDIDITIE